MVLTRLMATNNNHGDETHIIALKRQVQTLAMTVERLTKQNHDLEEQLRQRDAGPNNHGEEQEGTRAERKDQEGPEGNNALIRQELQDTSCPSVADMVPSHMLAKMQMMKERIDFMMNAFKRQMSNDFHELVHQTDLPLMSWSTERPQGAGVKRP